MLIIWLLVFGVSLFVLIKGADYFTEAAERIGLALKISPFVIGVTIVSIGTSLPELSTSIISAIKGQTAIVAANAIGSNIANILLIVGLLAIIGGRLAIKRRLIEMELPLLLAATGLITVIMWDRQVTLGEGIVAILGYLVYGAYAITNQKAIGVSSGSDLPATREGRHYHRRRERVLNFKLVLILLVSLVLIYFSADFTVKAIINLAALFNLRSSIVTMIILAIGTSLPELFVSILALKKGQVAIALGNVFGSNIFNALMVIGLPALIRPLEIDQPTFSVGIPFLIGATALYAFSGFFKKIHRWEGCMYLLIYFLFIAKLVNLF